MNISEQCKLAVVENGILMNNGEPAGRSLMALPVMKVALVQDAFPATLMTSELTRYLQENGHKLNEPDHFPDGIENAVRRAIGFWYKGEIQFVGSDDDPDLKIVAFDGPGTIGGFASSPINDNPELNERGQRSYQGLADPIIGIDMRSARVVDEYSIRDFTLLEGIESTIKHEFGHSLGVLHPHLILAKLETRSQSACNPKELMELSDEFAKGIMPKVSADPSNGSETDTLLRDATMQIVPKS